MNSEPTYIFKNGNVYTYQNGKIVASVKEALFVEEEASHLASIEGATHIETPNGLKGKVLGRVKGLWEDEVTVRFENGRIASLPVSKLTFSHEEEEDHDNDEIADLEKKVESSVSVYDADVIENRVRELDRIKVEASLFIDAGLSDEDLQRVGNVITQANYELEEIGDVIRALEEGHTSAYEAPAPFEIHVVEQGGPTNGREATWLDQAVNEMIHEANSTDYTKLMDEGPEVFTAGLDRETLVDSGTVRSLASSWIRSKTAAADDDVREKYEKVWLARVEEQRRVMLVEAKEEMHKEAAAEESVDYDSIGDDSLFI
jgi:exosome complex RNA-binding protein Csl4